MEKDVGKAKPWRSISQDSLVAKSPFNCLDKAPGEGEDTSSAISEEITEGF